MPVHERHLVSFDEVLFGLVFTNRLLFGMFFRKEDLTISPNRKDLPPEWHGKQVISTQQRLIKCDVSNKIAMRLGRKTDKTGTMEDEFFMRPLNYTGNKIIEGLFFTPGDAHMIPWMERLKMRISKVPLFNMMVSNVNTGKGIVTFRNSVTCYTRIEGTCLEGQSTVVDAVTGRLHTMEEIANGYRPLAIHTVDPDTYKVSITSDYKIVSNGTQMVYELVADNGNVIKATDNHPFLTPSGWMQLKDLSTDDYVAIAGNLPVSSKTNSINKEKARLLGYFIGDGCLTGDSPLFTNNDPGVIEDFSGLCAQFKGVTVKPRQEFQYAATINRGTNSNPLNTFLKSEGVWGKKAYDKVVPDSVWIGGDKVVAEFLAGLFACDGSVAFKKSGQIVISLASVNEKLIRQVSTLLLRFGIFSRIETRNTSKDRFKGVISPENVLWSLRISSPEHLIRFSECIKCRGRKGVLLEKIPDKVAGLTENGRSCMVPGEIVRREIDNYSEGLSSRNRWPNTATVLANPGFRYHSVRVINKTIKSLALYNLDKKDVLWVRVRSITPIGDKAVYDLQVSNTHSFIANNIVVHNSNTGRNMIGIRASYIIGDEADYGNEQSHIERKQTALPECTWMLGGVPRGIRDLNPFYRICTDPIEGRDWSIHKYPSFINPIYASEEAREQLKNDYGGELTLGYVTQVLAQDGDAVSSSFPMIPIKMDLSHQIFELTENDVINAADWDDILPVRALPQGISACVVGMDVGYSPDPSELGIFYRLGGIWHMHARITLRKVMYPVQARIVKWLHDKIGFHRIGIDNVGVGMGLYQHVQILLPDTLVGGQAGSKQDIPIMVHKICKTILQRREGDWWCAECQRFITREDDTEPASIQRKVYLTEHLKQAFHLGQQYVEQVGMYKNGQIPENEIAMVVPFDRQLEDELAGTSETKSRSGTVSYISPPSTGDHRTDMLRYAMGAILALNDQEINENVIRDAVNAGGGWANVRPMGSSVSAWRPPWQMG